MADVKTAIEAMNHRLLIAEGQVIALKEMVHMLFHLARATSPDLSAHLQKMKLTFESINDPDEHTRTYLTAASRLMAEVLDERERPPTFVVIKGGKSTIQIRPTLACE
jgi:hypothetical protein